MDVPSVDSSFGKKSIGSEKSKDEEKGLYFNLNSFEKKTGNRTPMIDPSFNSNKSFTEDSYSPEPIDADKESKRKNIYAKESFHEED